MLFNLVTVLEQLAVHLGCKASHYKVVLIAVLVGRETRLDGLFVVEDTVSVFDYLCFQFCS